MKYYTLIFVFIFTCIKLISAQNAHIQVICGPGISIFLDGNYKGKSNQDFGGMIIESVQPGNHSIKIVKDGYRPQEELISLNAGEVYSYKVLPFVPKIKITQQGNKKEQIINRKTGSLKIQSLPVEIEISISELGIKSLKTEDEWLAEEFPVGIYQIGFECNGKILQDKIKIKNGELTHWFVDMVHLEIIDKMKEAEQKKMNDEINEKAKYAFSQDISYGPTKVGCPSFSLKGRSAKSLPIPYYPGDDEGVVVVKITVDKYGNVTAAEPGGRGTTIENQKYWQETKNAALKSKFSADENAPVFQQGTISYRFVLD